MRFSARTTLLFTSGDSGLHVWDVARRTSRSLPRGDGRVTTIEVARNTVDADYQAALWDPATGEKVASLPEHALSGSIEISADGSTLATYFGDGIGFYDMTSFARTATVTPEIGVAAGETHLSPDGRLLLTQGRGGARLWDTARNVQIGPPIEAGRALGFAQDGRFFVTYRKKDKISQVWRTPDAWVEPACQAVTRNLTAAEWRRYVVTANDYVRACAAYPSGADAPADAPAAEYPDPFRIE